MKMTKEAREQFLAGVHVGVIAIERTDRAPVRRGDLVLL
jgi:hypothetical protein